MQNVAGPLTSAFCLLPSVVHRCGETGYSHLDNRFPPSLPPVFTGLRQAMGAHGDHRALVELRAPAARGKCPYAPEILPLSTWHGRLNGTLFPSGPRPIPGCRFPQSKTPHPRRCAGGAWTRSDRLHAISRSTAPPCADARDQARGKRAHAHLSLDRRVWIASAFHRRSLRVVKWFCCWGAQSTGLSDSCQARNSTRGNCTRREPLRAAVSTD
jgi:hypothetical protein